MELCVIKIGGNIIDDESKLSAFLASLSNLKGPFVLVHGGGKIATKTAEKLGIPTEMVEGRRITTEPMRDVVTMVYGGLVNKNIVSKLQSLNINAIGLTGADARAIEAIKRPIKSIDYGFVGDVVSVNSNFLRALLEAGLCPVMAPISFNFEHGLLNTNADTIASEVAKALSSAFDVKLFYCFERKGVLLDLNDENSVIKVIDKTYYASLKASKQIFEGMIPKIDNAFAAIDAGVKEVIICQAEEIQNAILHNNAGTKIRVDDK
jgi:acetylglutamate kinase